MLVLTTHYIRFRQSTGMLALTTRYIRFRQSTGILVLATHYLRFRQSIGMLILTTKSVCPPTPDIGFTLFEGVFGTPLPICHRMVTQNNFVSITFLSLRQGHYSIFQQSRLTFHWSLSISTSQPQYLSIGVGCKRDPICHRMVLYRNADSLERGGSQTAPPTPDIGRCGKVNMEDCCLFPLDMPCFNYPSHYAQGKGVLICMAWHGMA